MARLQAASHTRDNGKDESTLVVEKSIR